MRLSASLALTILACNEFMETSNAFNQKTNRKRSASAMARMLAKTEANAAGGSKNGGGGAKKNDGGGATESSGGRGGGANKNKKGGPGGATKSSGGGGGSANKNKKGGPSGNYNSSGPSKSRDKKNKKFADNGIHSAHLDANTSGITLADGYEYTYGTPITATFELTNDIIPSDTLATIDITKMGEWSMGIFMRMGNPQDGVLKPITSASPSITEEGGRRLVELVKRERKLRGLQEQQPPAIEPTGTQQSTDDSDGDATTTVPPMPDMEDTNARDPPTLNHLGSVTFISTDAATLDPNKVGLGFDIYLLDENGAAVIGPATFYMSPTADMVEAQEEAAKKGKNKPKSKQHPLAKFDHASKKKKKPKNSGGKKSKVQGGSPDAKGMGYGSGSDGGMVIAATDGTLADYILMTTLETYTLGDSVVVDYDLSPEYIVEEGARRMLKNNSGKDKSGNDSGKDKSGNDSGGGGGPPSDTTTVPPPGWDETTTTTTTTTTAEVFDPSMPKAPDTPDGWDGEIEGATVPDVEPTIDGTDMSLFTMGVYMRMAHPQGGKLDPILTIPFCEDDACGGKTTEELGSGEFNFSTNDLNVEKNGGGYDAWILNGLGVGVAGPYTFYVTE